MKINPDDSVNPQLSKYSLIKYERTIVEVNHVDDKFIYIVDNDSHEIRISDNEWLPILLDENWLEKLCLKEGQLIKNVRTDLDWQLKRLGRYYYLTSAGSYENPVIPVQRVHELQNWYFQLTNRPLKKA